MTNEKARDLLAMIKVKEPGEFIVNSWWGSFVKDYKEALQMAIEALEQQSCEDGERMKDYNLINQKATTCRHGGHCEWVACDKCNHYEPDGLNQQPCEDVISRQAVKRKLQEHHDLFIHAYGGFSNLPQNDKSRVDEINNCIAMVVNEPSVTPKEKTGHWIFKNDNIAIPMGYYQCSECEEGKVLHKDNFCPNCGAKMVEPQESEVDNGCNKH